MTALLLLLLAQTQPLNLNLAPIEVRDEGTLQSTRRAYSINCTGAGVTCSQAGAQMTLNVPGGGAGGSGGGLPTADGGTPAAAGAPFVTYIANGDLPTARVLTSGTNTTVDLGTAGAAKMNLSGTVAQGLGGTGAGALTCSAGQALVSNGTAYSCTSTLTASDVVCGTTCVADAEIAGVSGGKVSGAVASATALAADPTDCSAGQYATTIAASGNLTCAQVTTAQLGGTITNAQLASSYSGVGACGANTWASTLSANAAPTCTQPAFTSLSGSASLAQNGTGAGSPAAADSVLQSTGAGSTAWSGALPNCVDSAGQHINYTAATHAFSCGSTSSGGGGGLPTADAGIPAAAGAPFISYVAEAAPASLTNARVLTSGTNTTVDLGTAAQAKVNLSGTVPQTLGGTGAGALTCAAGQHLTSNGTVYSCSADTGSGAPTGATYITQTPDGTLSAEQAMSLSASGLVLNTTGTGVLSIYGGSTCGANQYATQTSVAGALTCSQVTTAQLSGTITNAQLASTYSGVGTCTNQFARVLNGNAAPTCASVASADLAITATSCTNQFVSAVSATGVGTCTTDTLASAQHANQGTTTTLLHGAAAGNPTWSGVALADHAANLGTTTTVLHGNAAGQPSYGSVALADMTPNLGTTTTVLHGNAAGAASYAGVSLTADTTANQGTATTLLHGNAAGQPSFAGVAIADLTATGTPSSSTYLRGDNTWATVAGGSGYATIQDETTPLTARATVNFTGAGVSCVDNAGATRTDCTISGGGVGSANVVGVDVTFNGPVGSTVVTGQAWVTGTSKVVCSTQWASSASANNTAEVHLVASLQPLVTDLVVGTGFTLYVYDAHQFGLSGTFHFSCTGA